MHDDMEDDPFDAYLDDMFADEMDLFDHDDYFGHDQPDPILDVKHWKTQGFQKLLQLHSLETYPTMHLRTTLLLTQAQEFMQGYSYSDAMRCCFAVNLLHNFSHADCDVAPGEEGENVGVSVSDGNSASHPEVGRRKLLIII